MKKLRKVKITDGHYKGHDGTVSHRAEDGDLIVLIDVDGDPLTPPVKVKVPRKWAKALGIIDFVLRLVLPWFYGGDWK